MIWPIRIGCNINTLHNEKTVYHRMSAPITGDMLAIHVYINNRQAAMIPENNNLI